MSTGHIDPASKSAQEAARLALQRMAGVNASGAISRETFLRDASLGATLGKSPQELAGLYEAFSGLDNQQGLSRAELEAMFYHVMADAPVPLPPPGAPPPSTVGEAATAAVETTDAFLEKAEEALKGPDGELAPETEKLFTQYEQARALLDVATTDLASADPAAVAKASQALMEATASLSAKLAARLPDDPTTAGAIRAVAASHQEMLGNLSRAGKIGAGAIETLRKGYGGLEGIAGSLAALAGKGANGGPATELEYAQALTDLNEGLQDLDGLPKAVSDFRKLARTQAKEAGKEVLYDQVETFVKKAGEAANRYAGGSATRAVALRKQLIRSVAKAMFHGPMRASELAGRLAGVSKFIANRLSPALMAFDAGMAELEFVAKTFNQTFEGTRDALARTKYGRDPNELLQGLRDDQAAVRRGAAAVAAQARAGDPALARTHADTAAAARAMNEGIRTQMARRGAYFQDAPKDLDQRVRAKLAQETVDVVGAGGETRQVNAAALYDKWKSGAGALSPGEQTALATKLGDAASQAFAYHMVAGEALEPTGMDPALLTPEIAAKMTPESFERYIQGVDDPASPDPGTKLDPRAVVDRLPAASKEALLAQLDSRTTNNDRELTIRGRLVASQLKAQSPEAARATYDAQLARLQPANRDNATRLMLAEMPDEELAQLPVALKVRMAEVMTAGWDGSEDITAVSRLAESIRLGPGDKEANDKTANEVLAKVSFSGWLEADDIATGRTLALTDAALDGMTFEARKAMLDNIHDLSVDERDIAAMGRLVASMMRTPGGDPPKPAGEVFDELMGTGLLDGEIFFQRRDDVTEALTRAMTREQLDALPTDVKQAMAGKLSSGWSSGADLEQGVRLAESIRATDAAAADRLISQLDGMAGQNRGEVAYLRAKQATDADLTRMPLAERVALVQLAARGWTTDAQKDAIVKVATSVVKDAPVDEKARRLAEVLARVDVDHDDDVARGIIERLGPAQVAGLPDPAKLALFEALQGGSRSTEDVKLMQALKSAARDPQVRQHMEVDMPTTPGAKAAQMVAGATDAQLRAALANQRGTEVVRQLAEDPVNNRQHIVRAIRASLEGVPRAERAAHLKAMLAPLGGEAREVAAALVASYGPDVGIKLPSAAAVELRRALWRPSTPEQEAALQQLEGL